MATDIRKNNFKKIIKFCRKQRVYSDIAAHIFKSVVTARKYVAILVDAGYCKKTKIEGKPKAGSRHFITAIVDELTDEQLTYVVSKLTELSLDEKNKHLAKLALIESDDDEDSVDESKIPSGVYLLSSSPTKSQAKKLKATQELRNSERVSPKVYAGISANMVW